MATPARRPVSFTKGTEMRLAILGAAFLIAAAAMLSTRYGLSAASIDGADGSIVWRIDHWTGQVSRCQSAQLFCQKVAY